MKTVDFVTQKKTHLCFTGLYRTNINTMHLPQLSLPQIIKTKENFTYTSAFAMLKKLNFNAKETEFQWPVPSKTNINIPCSFLVLIFIAKIQQKTRSTESQSSP